MALLARAAAAGQDRHSFWQLVFRAHRRPCLRAHQEGASRPAPVRTQPLRGDAECRGRDAGEVLVPFVASGPKETSQGPRSQPGHPLAGGRGRLAVLRGIRPLPGGGRACASPHQYWHRAVGDRRRHRPSIPCRACGAHLAGAPAAPHRVCAQGLSAAPDGCAAGGGAGRAQPAQRAGAQPADGQEGIRQAARKAPGPAGAGAAQRCLCQAQPGDGFRGHGRRREGRSDPPHHRGPRHAQVSCRADCGAQRRGAGQALPVAFLATPAAARQGDDL